MYQIHGTVLQHVDSSTYLGVIIADNLSWAKQVNTLAKKANSRLGFLRRNLKNCPQRLKKMSYVTLIRSMLEYSSPVWDPHLRKDVDAVERVQRRAARWISQDYDTRSSVTSMLSDLGLEELEKRRQDARVILMYKIIHGHVAVIPEDLNIEMADARTRASHMFKLKLPYCKTTESRQSFVARTVPTWNRLPASVAEAGSVQACKSQLAGRAV